MRARVHVFWLPKAGNGPHEYEDAFWPARATSHGARTLRCAVADGATEASFSGLWAKMLVTGFGRGRICSSRIVDTLAPLQTSWWDAVGRNRLPWYAEEKLRSGAFSSLLGLTLSEDHAAEAVHWSALAVGDSCLFVVRANELIASFPFQATRCFGNTPLLISSVALRNGSLETALHQSTGWCISGDRLYLLTDALAGWFLTQHEGGSQPWKLLDVLSDGYDGACFADWVAGERSRKCLRNDDVTLLRVQLE